VVDGDLQGALRRWQRIATENRPALARKRFWVGPAEQRRIKDRRALKRTRRRRFGR